MIADGFVERYGIGSDDVILVAAPAGHAVGFVYGVELALRARCATVLMPSWDPVVCAELTEHHGCTFVAAPTPFLLDVVGLASGAARRAFASLRVFLCGGASVPASLLERARASLPRTDVTAYYGTSECGGVTTCPPGRATREEAHDRRQAACGDERSRRRRAAARAWSPAGPRVLAWRGASPLPSRWLVRDRRRGDARRGRVHPHRWASRRQDRSWRRQCLTARGRAGAGRAPGRSGRGRGRLAGSSTRRTDHGGGRQRRDEPRHSRRLSIGVVAAGLKGEMAGVVPLSRATALPERQAAAIGSPT